MQITLNQDEIHEAVEAYVRNQITIAANQSIEIDFTAGRGPNGLSATLQISSKKEAAPSPAAQTIMKAVGRSMPEEPQAEAPEAPEMPEVAGAAVPPEAPEVEEAAPITKASPFKRSLKAASDDVSEEAEDAADSSDEEPAKDAPKTRSIFSKAG